MALHQEGALGVAMLAPGPAQLLRRQALLPQQGHHYHVVEGIAFAGGLAQQLLLHRSG